MGREEPGALAAVYPNQATSEWNLRVIRVCGTAKLLFTFPGVDVGSGSIKESSIYAVPLTVEEPFHACQGTPYGPETLTSSFKSSCPARNVRVTWSPHCSQVIDSIHG